MRKLTENLVSTDVDEFFRTPPEDVEPDEELNDELSKLEDELPERYKKLL